MKQLYFYVQDPEAFKLWTQASQLPTKLLYQLDELAPVKDTEEALYLIHLQPTDPIVIEKMLIEQRSLLLFSDTPTPEEGLYWFQKGIKGYLNTYAQPERIRQAIDALLNQNIWLGQNIMSALIQGLQQPQLNLSWQDPLTEREIETAQKVLEGLSNAEIAADMSITERTVKSHIHNLLEKFEVKDRLALVLKIQKLQQN